MNSFNVYIWRERDGMPVVVSRPGKDGKTEQLFPGDIEDCGEMVWNLIEEVYATRRAALTKVRDEAVQKLAKTQAFIDA